MDPMDISAATSTGERKRHLNKKGRNWHKRPHLRKAASQPLIMQSEEKCGPKKTAEEWGQSKLCLSSKRSSKEAKKSCCLTNDCDNLLKFTCIQCSDNLEYAPKDLVRHFEDKHRGSTPVFSCHLCTFKTHQLSYLQIHLLSHKDTFSSCSICNDGVQRTWPEFSAHLTRCHCQNGKYSCETCCRFSTDNVSVFLEHMYFHNLGLEGAKDVLLLHTKDKNQSGPKPTTLSCQHCGYEASHKWLLTKHIKTIHVCQNGDRRQKKREVKSIVMKPNDPVPKMKPRLTRSAVREMCWLTQDCLSLPGREFLDKYCHLSDPQTTLEETQQFLMKSVAVETGDQKWTKALKTVLSNVPQDVNLHPKSENGLVSNSSDLTVLTVKKKITVAQHDIAYTKRLGRMPTSDNETVLPGSAADDAPGVVDQNGRPSTVNDYLPCPQNETKLHNALVSARSETTECTQVEENIENQDLETDGEMEEHCQNHQEAVHQDVIISSELRLTNESVKQTCINKFKPMRRNRRWKRRTMSKKVDVRSPGLPLKIVLKKNPVKEKQWVSKSSLSSSGRDSAAHIFQSVPLLEVHQQKLTKASETDLCDMAEAIQSNPQSKQEELIPICTSESVGSKKNINEPDRLKELPSTQKEMRDDLEKSLQFSQTGFDKRSSAVKMAESNLRTEAETKLEMCLNTAQQLQTSGSGVDHHESGDKKTIVADEVTPSSCTKSSPVSQPVIIPQGDVTLDHSRIALSLEKSNHSVNGIRDREVPVESSSDLLSSTYLPVGKAIQQEPSPASGHQWHLVPKNKERTLKLVAINPSQLVKRPAGDQPVVVLNHPDADIPEVARIMEVINRYRGEVQKVMLSRRTLNALSAMTGEAPMTHGPTEVPPHSEGKVKERFILKLKFRRLSKKKYEVVGAVSPSREVATVFRCWFCGRVFASQEMWMAHRQRHLLEWKKAKL